MNANSPHLERITPKLKTEDLVLPAETIRRMNAVVQEYDNKEELRSYDVGPRNRILMAGPPGNGKTSLAGAFSEQLDLTMYRVDCANLIGSHLGEFGKNIKRVFADTQDRPCLIFFDEFEEIGRDRTQRDGQAVSSEMHRGVNILLQCIDALSDSTVVVCATNYPELLDRALLRRFQLELHLPNPDLKSLTQHVSKWFTKRTNVELPYDFWRGRLKEKEAVNFDAGTKSAEELLREWVMFGEADAREAFVSKLLGGSSD